MKVTCNIIRDILPLYVENMASDDSCRMVEEHVNQCEACKNQLDEMKSNNKPPIDTDLSPLIKIKSTLRKKKLQTIIFSIMVTTVICFVAIAFLTAPVYNPYNREIVSVSKNNDGSVMAKFSNEVSGYDIGVYPAQYGNGNDYHITTWDSIWNRNINKVSINNTILNPNGEVVNAVYYYTTDGSSDILIYGQDQGQDIVGGVLTLPRLFLGFFLMVASILLTLCILTLFVFRRRKKVKEAMVKIAFLPISYILGHFLIKGLNASSYSGVRDFLGILLVTIPLYIAFLSANYIVKEYKTNKSD